eukprot:6207655-Pleurochrysis_carterae.AAC.2
MTEKHNRTPWPGSSSHGSGNETIETPSQPSSMLPVGICGVCMAISMTVFSFQNRCCMETMNVEPWPSRGPALAQSTSPVALIVHA